MKKLNIILLSFLFGLTLARANATFEQANQLYQEAMYDSAAGIYENLLADNTLSAEVYYNLGNCYYRLDKIALAILNYERALKLQPNDEDILFNLRLANLRIVDKIEPLPRLFLFEWWDELVAFNNSSSWAIIFVLFIWGIFFLAVLIMMSYSSKIKQMALIFLLVFACLSMLTYVLASQRLTFETESNFAIVFNDNAYIKNAPNGNLDLFILHEGVKLELLDKVGDWRKIKLADGKVGWVNMDAIVVI